MLPSPHISSQPTRGFTLIELLTVVAIIAILAAILIPVTGHVRSVARRAQSLANLRGIGSASMLYVGDHRGFFPFLASNGDGGYTGTGWQPLYWSTAIEPYLPSRESKTERSPALIDPLVPDGKHHDDGDYGGNTHLFTQPWNHEAQMAAVSLSRPSQTILAMSAKTTGGGASWYLNQAFESGDDSAHPGPDDRGTGLYFCVFADGHAEELPVAALATTDERHALLVP